MEVKSCSKGIVLEEATMMYTEKYGRWGWIGVGVQGKAWKRFQLICCGYEKGRNFYRSFVKAVARVIIACRKYLVWLIENFSTMKISRFSVCSKHFVVLHWTDLEFIELCDMVTKQVTIIASKKVAVTCTLWKFLAFEKQKIWLSLHTKCAVVTAWSAVSHTMLKNYESRFQPRDLSALLSHIWASTVNAYTWFKNAVLQCMKSIPLVLHSACVSFHSEELYTCCSTIPD